MNIRNKRNSLLSVLITYLINIFNKNSHCANERLILQEAFIYSLH